MPATTVLGQFSNHKPGGEAVGGLIDTSTFHAQSRDFVCRDAGKAGKADGKTAARRVYESTVCLFDGDEAERQTRSGVCMRVEVVRRVVCEAQAAGWTGLG